MDGDNLSFTLTAQPAHGALSGTPPQLTYTPDADYHGTDSFSFQVNDGTLSSASATVSLTIRSVNDAPVVDSLSRSIAAEPTALVLTATDADGDTLSFSIQSQPTHGTLSGMPPR